jgi:hypothetical protein
MCSVETFEIKTIKAENKLYNNLFIDSHNRFIYSFLNNVVKIYTKYFDFVNKITLFESDNIIKIKQLQDDTFIIITNENVIHYSPPNLIELVSYEKNLCFIYTSPDDKWMLLYNFTYKYLTNSSRNPSYYICKILKFYNFKLFEDVLTGTDNKNPIQCNKIIGICNDGSILLTDNNIIIKYYNSNNYKSTSFNVEWCSAFCLSSDGKKLIAVNEYNVIILINVDNLSLISIIPIYNMSYRHDTVDDIIYLIDSKISNIKIFDIYHEQITHIINIDWIKSALKNIRKKDNLLVLYTYTNETYVYDLITNKINKTFLIPDLINISTSQAGHTIIYSPDKLAVFDPLLGKESEQAFLTGSLVCNNNLPCAANKFMNSEYFDRHLLSLIFEFLPRY